MTDIATPKTNDMAAGPKHPYAQSADVLSSVQKDAFHQAVLQENILDLVRKLFGARRAQNLRREVQSVSLLLYLTSTTLIGNRTLGEEYCGIVSVESESQRLPSFGRRAGIAFSSSALRYLQAFLLPHFLGRLQAELDSGLRSQGDLRGTSRLPTASWKVFLQCMSGLALPNLLQSLFLALFYFRGAYYQLSKLLFRIRYVYPKRSDSMEERGGYEILGLLLVLQAIVHGVSRIQSTIYVALQERNKEQVSPDDPSQLLALRSPSVQQSMRTLKSAFSRYALEQTQAMEWIQDHQRRKCILCLDALKDPSVTSCGHVFCWACITTWIREKPECPLCRQQLMAQRVLPIRC